MEPAAMSTERVEEVRFVSGPIEQDRVLYLSAAGNRLFWTLNGSLESAIQVAPSEYYEPGDVMEPYFIPAATDDLGSTWHPLSQESLMEPPVSSITVRISCIDAWDQLWVELCGDSVDAESHNDRPRSEHVQLKVTAAHEFLTVHDYVSAVHPWLMGTRGRILGALGKLGGTLPWSPETELAVMRVGQGPLRIDSADKWADYHKKPTAVPMTEQSYSEEEVASKVVGKGIAQRFSRSTEATDRDGC